MNKNACIVSTTTDDEVIAEKLAKLAIDLRLAGCVQVVPGITSFYRWQGKVEKADEILLQFKTIQSRSNELMEMLKNNHPYDVPEIIMTQLEDIDENYHNWLKLAVSNKTQH